MIRHPLRERGRAASVTLAGILVLAACGGEPATETGVTQAPPSPPGTEASPPEPPPSPPGTEASPPEPPPPPAEPAEAPAEPASPPPPAEPPTGPLTIHVDTDTVWQDVFDSVSGAEQSCIRGEVDGDVLDSALEERVMSDDETEDWMVSIFDCLTPENARYLFLNSMVVRLREDLDVEEVSDEEMACLRDLVADVDVAALVAADAAGEADLEFADLSAVLIGCLPDMFLQLMVAEFGVDLDELSEEELSCMREWMSTTDWAALMSAEDDAEALDAFGGLFELFSCVPGLFDPTDAPPLPDPQAGTPGDLGDLTGDATAVTVGEPVRGGVDHPGDVDIFTFEAVAGEPYRIEVTLDSLEDSVVSLYDADGWELAFNDDHGESLASLITWLAPESGRNYVAVASYDESGTGSYTLSVTSE